MNMRERIIYIVVTVVLAILLLKTCKDYKNCRSGKSDYRDSVRTVIRIDTIKGESSTKYVPKPFKVTKHDTLEVVYVKKDTQYIEIPASSLQEELCPISQYSDTLRFDKNGYAVVKDSVMGSILKRTFQYETYKTTVTNNVILQRRNKAFIGYEMTYPIDYFGINFAFQFKNSDNLINLGAGFANSKVYYKAGMLIKIKL